MSVRILNGDCRSVLSTLPAESVHCCVTSPPYWGLRDYGTAKWDGGDPNCDHRAPDEAGQTTKPSSGQREHAGRFAGDCRKCGARRIDSQIGLEPTIAEYIAEMVSVFRAVHRVLRPDGTCWINLGDSYAGGGRGGNPADSEFQKQATNAGSKVPPSQLSGLKPKDLCGIPWRVAFALQADGWYLRQDIIWAKPNPMPESVTDRCTKAHEYLFLLSKGPRYFYDAEAIKETSITEDTARPRGSVGANQLDARGNAAQGIGKAPRNALDCAARNKRSVWTVATSPFPEAHFATFPPELIIDCIKAGTSEKGCCAKCGAPWERQLERVDKGWDGSKYGERAVGASGGAITGGTAKSTLGSGNGKLVGGRETTGWQPTCKCDAPTVPCTVLDPFGGAGTTGLVADRLQRNAILIELNPTYAAMAERRIHNDAPLFAAAE